MCTVQVFLFFLKTPFLSYIFYYDGNSSLLYCVIGINSIDKRVSPPLCSAQEVEMRDFTSFSNNADIRQRSLL